MRDKGGESRVRRMKKRETRAAHTYLDDIRRWVRSCIQHAPKLLDAFHKSFFVFVRKEGGGREGIQGGKKER